ncbi:efflux RND transporter periplasmic adaptor subunit [Dechloromonas sp. HYN0024]|uniref:efflux RND transporter periplasmic adaptor subunit n=1 Tax=Dechloromonas sp. HYN0024 TaxID=2231055 RepID=UPI000E42D612|nr:efflux RND transporter periplasmic adaptor subunit [Dechloromonas sp. HYN0024]AXS80421.1 efflux RND transporter periplasmic adaptor subunit [Dechloromonas sp. HYN0024]
MKQTFILSSILLALAGCTAEPEAPREATITVSGEIATLAEPAKATFLKVAAVERDKGGMLSLPGRLVWNEEKTVRVFPQLGGRVQRIAVDVGNSVKINQPLTVLSSPDYGQALADAHKTKADAVVAGQELARSRLLREAGVVAEKDWQLAEAAAVSARAEADRANRRLAGLGGEGDGSYVLRTPLAGVVVERNLNPGMEFRPDQAAAPLFVITDPASLWVQIDAGEADLASLKKGDSLFVESKQYPGERFKGVIRHVADFVDPASRTIKVRGEVPNADRRLKGEMFVNALVELPATQALRAPANAVFLIGEKRYVFVEEALGRYRRQQVEAGGDRDGWIVLLAGVHEGDRVVTEGNLNLLKFFKPAVAEKQAAK